MALMLAILVLIIAFFVVKYLIPVKKDIWHVHNKRRKKKAPPSKDGER